MKKLFKAVVTVLKVVASILEKTVILADRIKYAASAVVFLILGVTTVGDPRSIGFSIIFWVCLAANDIMTKLREMEKNQ
jgi:hypothetical protein